MTTTQTAIQKGSIVLFDGGWYRVTAMTKNTVNLGAVWGGRIYHKRVDIAKCQEDEAAWYANWQKSDQYQCM